MAAGGLTARVLWLVLWGGLALLSLRTAVRSPAALRGAIMAGAGGQPRWLAAADDTAAGLLGHHGALAGFALGGLLAVIASGVFWPARARRVILGVAAMLAVVLWAAGQNLGGVFTGMATDPSSGPLLLLLALAYWPLPAAGAAAGAPGAVGEAAGQVRTARTEAGRGSLAVPLLSRDIDVMNVAMALAMISMLAGRPSPLLDRLWVLTFTAAAAWFAGHAISGWRRRSVPGWHVMHLLSCGGMLVMLDPRAGTWPMGSMSPAGPSGGAAEIMPALAAAFAVAMAASVVMITDRLTQVPVSGGAAAGGPAVTGAAVARPGRYPRSGPVCPRLRVSCQVAMGLAMACMLIQML